MEPLHTSFLFGAVALSLAPGWLPPALVALMGLSLLNHSNGRWFGVPRGGPAGPAGPAVATGGFFLSAREAAFVSVADRGLAHAIALGSAAEALALSIAPSLDSPLPLPLLGYWACLAWTAGAYHLRSAPLAAAGLESWKPWHASIHVSSCVGLLLLEGSRGSRSLC
jgi:hypothetical protein